MYKLEYSKKFLFNLEEIRDFIESDNPTYAVITVQSIFQTVNLLKLYPKIGVELKDEYRQIVENRFKYKIIYKLGANNAIKLVSVYKYR